MFARIGWNLRRLRKERDVTQENFATDSGFDRGYISGVERGVRNPSATVLAKIADALEVEVAELFDARKAKEFSSLPRRSEERRVGEECVSTCRSGRSQNLYK